MLPFEVRRRSLRTRQRLPPSRSSYDLASHQELSAARQCFWACSAWSSSHLACAIGSLWNIESLKTSLQGPMRGDLSKSSCQRVTIAIYCCAPGAMRKGVQEALESAITEFEKRQQAKQERLRE